MAKDGENICLKRQSELCLLYRKWIQLCTVKHATTKLQWPQGRSPSSLGVHVKWGHDYQPLVLFFKSDGNCLTSWLVTFRRHQNHSLFLHLGWCSCRHQLAEDPANTYFSSESDHWQIAAVDVSVAKCPWGTQKLHWAQLKLSSTLLQHSLSTSSDSEPVSISSIALSWICYNSCKTKKSKKHQKNPNPKPTKVFI